MTISKSLVSIMGTLLSEPFYPRGRGTLTLLYSQKFYLTEGRSADGNEYLGSSRHLRQQELGDLGIGLALSTLQETFGPVDTWEIAPLYPGACEHVCNCRKSADLLIRRSESPGTGNILLEAKASLIGDQNEEDVKREVKRRCFEAKRQLDSCSGIAERSVASVSLVGLVDGATKTITYPTEVIHFEWGASSSAVMDPSSDLKFLKMKLIQLDRLVGDDMGESLATLLFMGSLHEYLREGRQKSHAEEDIKIYVELPDYLQKNLSIVVGRRLLNDVKVKIKLELEDPQREIILSVRAAPDMNDLILRAYNKVGSIDEEGGEERFLEALSEEVGRVRDMTREVDFGEKVMDVLADMGLDIRILDGRTEDVLWGKEKVAREFIIEGRLGDVAGFGFWSKEFMLSLIRLDRRYSKRIGRDICDLIRDPSETRVQSLLNTLPF